MNHPEIVKINSQQPEASLVTYVAEKIRSGLVLGMPTDTFYGLAADPFNLHAVDRVYEIKNRSRHKPLSLLIESVDQAADLAWPVPETARQQVEDLGHRPGQVGGLVHRLDQQRKRLVPRAVLDLVHTVDGVQVEWIGGQTVESVGRHAQHLTRADLLRHVGDQGAFRLLAVDFDDFGAHPYLFFLITS